MSKIITLELPDEVAERWEAMPEERRNRIGLAEALRLIEAEQRQEDEFEDDPLLGIIGIGKGGPIDGAENHDEALYRCP